MKDQRTISIQYVIGVSILNMSVMCVFRKIGNIEMATLPHSVSHNNSRQVKAKSEEIMVKVKIHIDPGNVNHLSKPAT